MSPSTTSQAPTPDTRDVSPVASYDSRRRELARAAGEPTDRTRGAGFPQLESGRMVFCWTDHATERVVHKVDDFDTDAPRPLTVSLLADLFDRDFAVVVPDSGTVTRMMRATASALASGRCEQDQGNALRRRLDIASRMSASSRLVVLTRALARRYWMPSNLSADDPLAWGRAFGLVTGKGVTHRLMAQLTRLAADGSTDSHSESAAKAESNALGAARYPGLKMAVVAYQSVERAEASVSAWTRLDDRLLERNVLSGDVCRLSVESIGAKGFTAVASQPFTMRTGKRHLLMTASSMAARAAGKTGEAEGRMGHVTLESVEIVGEQVMVEVATSGVNMPSRNGGQVTTPASVRAKAALSTGEALYLTEEPFNGGWRRGAPPTGRWSASGVPTAVTGRWNMPLDVAFAGAPRSGA